MKATRAHILCAKRTFLIFYTPTGPKEQKDEKWHFVQQTFLRVVLIWDWASPRASIPSALILYVITDSGLDMNNWGETAVNTEALNDATIDEVHAAQL